jgi:glycosyltransferase involved in cell wall biosynthesis
MKVLFLVPYPTEGASNRIRVEQYLSYLESKGIKYKVRPFVSKGFYKILYHKRHYLRKTLYFIISAINRFLDIVRALNYELVFIHREAFPFGPAFIEYILKKLKKPIIYDFDDAIFLPNTSEPNNFIEKFKRPEKISKIVALSHYVIAGNKYLANFALKYNKNVAIIPSVIDTNIYYPSRKSPQDRKEIIIGWIGSITTRRFLDLISNVFRVLSKKYDYVRFKIIGTNFYIPSLKNINCQKWSLDKEVADLLTFDIGIMPLPDNLWTRGKCGFKAVLYMSMGIPVVCSSTGVNKEIIQEGINGFLADSEEEWIEKLSFLIEDPDLRYQMGQRGRIIVEEKYSLKANAPKFIEILEKVYYDKK